MRLVYYFFLFICSFTVFLEALYPAWRAHLVFDVYTYYERASYFISHFNFQGVLNEYHPGAILFFILLSPTLLINPSIDFFITLFLITNFLLLFLLAFLIEKFTEGKNILLLAILILFTGPILFYRFELLVVCLTVASLYFLKKHRFSISILILASAVLTKLYPLIYLPYFLWVILKEKNFKEAIKQSIIFSGFMVSSLLIYLLTLNINLSDFIYSLNYHSLKPIGVEGAWTSFISTVSMITAGSPPPLISGNKTWGISAESLFIPSWLINNFWILAVEVIYLTFISFKRSPKLIEDILLITLTLVIFSKLSSPQYLIWLLFLLPLISFDKYLKDKKYTFLFLLCLPIAFLSQYVYPLNYDSFLQFFRDGSNAHLVYLNMIKNIMLISLIPILISKNES